jgi:hypothetical protein
VAKLLAVFFSLATAMRKSPASFMQIPGGQFLSDARHLIRRSQESQGQKIWEEV